MYYSTFHWLPVVNGYTSYVPPAYGVLANYAAQLPTEPALQRLADCTGIGWILVHGNESRNWRGLSGVRLVRVFPGERGPDRLYRVAVRRQAGCTAYPQRPGVTMDGNAAVLPATLPGDVSVVDLPAAMTAGGEQLVTLVVENQGAALWPCTSPDPASRVAVTVGWDDAARVTLVLPRDVPAGGRLSLPVWLAAPGTPGAHRLRVELVAGTYGRHAPEFTRAVVVVPPAPHARRR